MNSMFSKFISDSIRKNLGKAKKYEILLEPVFHTMTIAHKLIRISLLPYFKNIYASPP